MCTYFICNFDTYTCMLSETLLRMGPAKLGAPNSWNKIHPFPSTKGKWRWRDQVPWGVRPVPQAGDSCLADHHGV